LVGGRDRNNCGVGGSRGVGYGRGEEGGDDAFSVGCSGVGERRWLGVIWIGGGCVIENTKGREGGGARGGSRGSKESMR